MSAAASETRATAKILLTVKEVAEITHLSASTLSRLINSGQLIALRIGKRSLRIHREDLDIWMDSRRSQLRASAQQIGLRLVREEDDTASIGPGV